jgi:hypothetical protein
MSLLEVVFANGQSLTLVDNRSYLQMGKVLCEDGYLSTMELNPAASQEPHFGTPVVLMKGGVLLFRPFAPGSEEADSSADA